jgi:hypothetical protein
MSEVRTGGCQCGATRFRVSGPLGRASICHCRMCQKAFGGFYGPLVSVEVKDLAWTRGAPKHFQSSNKVRRGFCGDCGTPLTFEWSEAVHELAIGAFDDPRAIAPAMQNARDERLPYVDDLHTVPGRSPEQEKAFGEWRAQVVSYQHPDHDTDVWPPPRG